MRKNIGYLYLDSCRSGIELFYRDYIYIYIYIYIYLSLWAKIKKKHCKTSLDIAPNFKNTSSTTNLKSQIVMLPIFMMIALSSSLLLAAETKDENTLPQTWSQDKTTALKDSTRNSLDFLGLGTFFVDKNQSETIESIQTSNFSRFSAVEKLSDLNLLHDAKVVWFKTSFHIPKSVFSPPILTTYSPFIERVDFWVFDQNETLIKTGKSGWRIPSNERSHQGRRHGITLDIPVGKSYSAVIKVTGGYITEASTALLSKEEQERISLVDMLYFSFYFGMVIGLLIYNSFSFYTTRDSIYLVYVFMLLSSASTIFTFDAPLEFWINQKFNIQIPSYKYIIHAFTSISLSLLTIKFLGAHIERYRILALAHISLVISCAAVIVNGLMGLNVGELVDIAGLFAMLSIVVTSGWYYLKGYRPARFLFLSGLTLFVFSIGFHITVTNHLADFYYSEKIISMAALIEVFFMSMSLSDWLNSLRLKYTTSLKSTTDSLEKQVIARTEELSLANLELEEQLNEKKTALEMISKQQKQIAQSAQRVTLGEISAGVVHEIRQPLGILSQNIASLRSITTENLTSGTNHIGAVTSKMMSAINSMSSIVDKIRIFSGSKTNETSAGWSLQSMVSGVISLSEHKAQAMGVKIYSSGKSQKQVYGNPAAIGQIILALVNNALDAASKKPAPIKQGSQEQPNDQPNRPNREWIRVTIEENQKKANIRISVEDSGFAIPEETEKKIFDPFYTTKKDATHFGLGLSTALTLANDNACKLHYDSSPKRFVLEMPQAIGQTSIGHI